MKDEFKKLFSEVWMIETRKENRMKPKIDHSKPFLTVIKLY